MSEWHRPFERLFRRIQQTVFHAVTTAPRNEAGVISTVQVALSSIAMRDGVRDMQLFGFIGSPPVGSDVIGVSLAGDPSNIIIIASNNQATRPLNFRPGEAALYNAFGLMIKLDQSAGTVVTADNLPVSINGACLVFLQAPVTLTTGNVVVGTGASGSFTTPLGQVVTVQDGIIMNIF